MREHHTPSARTLLGRLLPARRRARRVLAGVAALVVTAPLATVATLAPAAAAEEGPFGPWQWANPQPQGSDLEFAAFNDAGTVIAGGGVGTLLRSTDLGQTWTQLPNPASDAEAAPPIGDVVVRDAQFLDANTAVAVGDSGIHNGHPVIMRSTDGGVSWSDAETIPESANDILGVSFADATTGYAVGSEVGSSIAHAVRSTDGGRTWEKPFQFSMPANQGYSLLDVSAPTLQTAFATSNDARVVRTTNGGDSWQPIVQLGNFLLHAVDFIDADTGVVVGDGGRIFRTADGGDTWRQVPSDVFQHRLMDVMFVTDQIGYVVGELPSLDGRGSDNSGVVLKTEDAGKSWTKIADTPQWARGVAFADQDTGVVVGAKGMMLRSTDGGQNWTPHWSAVTTLGLNGVAFPAPDNGWAVGGGLVGGPTLDSTLLRSTDGGHSWTQQEAPTTNVLFDVDFADPIHGVAVGGNGTILRTVDGGDSWTEQDSGISCQPTDPRDECDPTVLRSVSCPTVNVCTAVGDGRKVMGERRTTILRSADGGASWEESQWEGVGTLKGVDFKDENVGFAVGRRGSVFSELSPLVLRTSDGGVSWQDVSPPPVAPASDGQLFMDVAFVGANTWVAVGDPLTGKVQRTTDGGASWSVPAEIDKANVHFRSVAFADDGTGYVGGLQGTIWRTTDGGVTWSMEQRRAYTLEAVALVDPADSATAVAVGPGGAILRRSGDGGGDPGDPGDPPGEPSEGSQDIVATVPETPGEGSLVLSVDPNDRTVTLPEMADAGDRLAASGQLRPVTVTDTRAEANPGWDASAQVSDFANAADASVTFDGGYLGWSPNVASQSSGQTVTAGAQVAPGFPEPAEAGLSVPQTLATAPTGSGVGTAVLGAGLALELPTDTPAGTYTAVLTLTAI